MRGAIVLFAVLAVLAARAGRTHAAEPPGLGTGPGAEDLRSRAVLDSFAPPGATPRGLDWDPVEGVLYHCDDDAAGGAVYSITPEGAATLLFEVSAQTGYKNAGATGICHVRDDSLGVDYLYVTDYEGSDDTNDIVYQFTVDGTLVEEYPLLGIDAICAGVMGIAFDGEHFWLSCLGNPGADIVKCDMAFTAVDSFFHPGGTGGGMDYDSETGTLYMTEYFDGTAYVTDLVLDVLDSFPAHPVAFQMVGVAIGRGGRPRSLWTSSFNPSWRYIYEIDDEYYNSPVESVSWGTIKSLYR
jgi:hypothetical protein